MRAVSTVSNFQQESKLVHLPKCQTIPLTSCVCFVRPESADIRCHGSRCASGRDKETNTTIQCMYITLAPLLVTCFFTCTCDGEHRQTHHRYFLLLLFAKQLGANGYIFAIDPNGYLLLHPNLQPKVKYI